MPFWESGQKWVENPYAKEGWQGLEDWGAGVGLSKAGKTAKGILNQFNTGDYSGMAGTQLSPIHDRAAANLRERLRAGSMGANAFMAGAQPGLMRAFDDQARAESAEQEGLAYGQAIPQLYGQAAQIFQNASDSRDRSQLAAMEAAMRARLSSGQFVNTPSTWDKIQSGVHGAAGILSLI